jgi:hypothetical protein
MIVGNQSWWPAISLEIWPGAMRPGKRICKLRKKLAKASDGKDYIETVWGRGHVLREPSEDEARTAAAP